MYLYYVSDNDSVFFSLPEKWGGGGGGESTCHQPLIKTHERYKKLSLYENSCTNACYVKKLGFLIKN